MPLRFTFALTGWVVMTGAVLTPRLKDWVAVAPTASVTVTVKVVAARVTVGVPEIAPVAAAMDRPAGSAGAIV